MISYRIETKAEQFVPITAQVRQAVESSGVANGLCVVYCPHTTAGITVNENADPDVQTDLLLSLNKAFPLRPEFRHFEGNSAAHAKASAMGVSQTLLIQDGQLVLGRWQGIYFCEFDGPRNRQFYVQILGN